MRRFCGTYAALMRRFCGASAAWMDWSCCVFARKIQPFCHLDALRPNLSRGGTHIDAAARRIEGRVENMLATTRVFSNYQPPTTNHQPPLRQPLMPRGCLNAEFQSGGCRGGFVSRGPAVSPLLFQFSISKMKSLGKLLSFRFQIWKV